MFKWISNLQKKPEGYRRNITILMSIGLTLIIITVWLTTLFSGGFLSNDTKDESDFSLDEVRGPLQSLRSSLGGAMKSFRGIFDGATEGSESPF
jgi:hypothetical protein